MTRYKDPGNLDPAGANHDTPGPEPFSDMSDDSKAVWLDAVASAPGCFGTQHKLGLRLFCEAIAEYLKLSREAEFHDDYDSPIHKLRWQIWDRAMRAAMKFGLTPGLKASKLEPVASENDDPGEQYKLF